MVAEAPAGRLPKPKHYARRAYRGEGGTQAPALRPPELMKVRDRILHARELSLNEPQSDVGIAVEGAAAVADRLGLDCRSFHDLREVLPTRALFLP
jgi:hypothetical protein